MRSPCANHIVYTVQTIPDPKQRGQEYYVSNPDGVLQREAVNNLNRNSADLEKMTEVELCVVAIESFDEENYGDAHSFALDLFNTWGIGKKDKNKGVLLFLARQSRDVQIITGGGVEGLLPDVTCGQILDNNLSYLSAGDFDNGLVYISKEISNHLTTDAAKAELLLGWKPKENYSNAFNYFIWGFVILIILALIGYKRLQGEPGDGSNELRRKSKDTQTASGCLSWLFPFPILLFYLYYRYARKHVKQVPLKCPHCGKEMKILSEEEDTKYLNGTQLQERILKSMEYNVWQCPDCQTTKLISHKGQTIYKYEECPECKARAYETIDRLTLQNATYTSKGKRRDTKRCAVCGFVGTAMVVLPMLAHTTSSGGGYRSSGGGGYRSSGGGRGSWGGGRSFGGGAGRKF